MLSPKFRIKKKKDFNCVFEKGKFFKGNFFYIKVCVNNLSLSRFGIIVSKKVSNRAVKRNKIKRRVRAACAQILKSGVKNGFDIIIMANPPSLSSNFRDIKKALKSILERANLLNYEK